MSVVEVWCELVVFWSKLQAQNVGQWVSRVWYH